MTIVKPNPATPRFALSQEVAYTDCFGKPQTGQILNIEAKWTVHRPSDNECARIAYTVTHPFFHVGHVYLREDELAESVTKPEDVPSLARPMPPKK